MAVVCGDNPTHNAVASAPVVSDTCGVREGLVLCFNILHLCALVLLNGFYLSILYLHIDIDINIDI